MILLGLQDPIHWNNCQHIRLTTPSTEQWKDQVSELIWYICRSIADLVLLQMWKILVSSLEFLCGVMAVNSN
jgi:hypothetical protein